jgi:chromosome segregation ATPase
VKRPVYQKGGELAMEKGLPSLEPVKDKAGGVLKAQTELLAEQAKLHAAIAKEQQEISALAKQAAEQTEEVRRLFTQIERAAQARQGSQEEQRYLEQILYNVQVEAELLQARQQELQARVNELKSPGSGR